jgi:hypothetical protein
MRNFFSTNLFRISAIALFSIPLIVIFRFLAPTSANAPLSRTPTTVATVETTEFAIAAPYWSVEDGFVSTIEMKNYRVDQSLTIMPILYPLHGSAVALDPVALNPSETRLLNINDALAAHHKHFTVGSVEIRYADVTESVLGANLTVLNKEKSLIFDFQFRMPEMSPRLEGLWWFYDEHTDGFIAVHNTSDDAVTATPTFYAQQHPHQLEPLHLQPHEMRLIELRKELNKLELGETTGGGIRIESSKSNAVIAGGCLVNSEIGFSAPLRMDDPEMQAMRASRLGKTLHALMVSIGKDSSMMPMGLPPGTLMNPIVNLRNVTEGNIGVKLVFRYQVGTLTQSFTMPTMQLGAQEIKRLNLLPYWQSGQIPQTISSGSLEMSYTGKSGSLVASATSVDQTGTYVFDAKIDNRLAAGFQGEYWSTEGDNDTSITVKNITQKEAKAWPSFQYDSGRGNYEMPAMTLQPGESGMIDLKMLQMEKMPGAKGEILPETATFGGMTLREEPGGRHFLIDAVVFNPKTATCGVCGYGCLYPQSLITIPGGMALVVGELSGALGVQANMCDGTHQLGWQCSCDFASGNSSIATINEFCTNYITGVAPGSTLANGTAVGVPGPHCGDQTLFLSCNVTVAPSVFISGPNAVPLGTDVNTIQLTAAGTPSGGTYSWSTTSSLVSLTNTSSATVTVRSVSQSSSQNDVTINLAYTKNVQTAHTLTTVTVQKPSSLFLLATTYQGSPYGFNACASGSTGWERDIGWQVSDQFGSPMQFANMSASDTITLGQPNTCGASGPHTGRANTDASGQFRDFYSFCSPGCTGAGCQLQASQSWVVNGISLASSISVFYTCTSITLNGQ